MPFSTFQHTAARRRLGQAVQVSAVVPGFNTQPPEGGWATTAHTARVRRRFNTQPPEGGWLLGGWRPSCNGLFQHTAARRRLAVSLEAAAMVARFQHTAARRRLEYVDSMIERAIKVSTHSRPKAAGNLLAQLKPSHSFQHTAARRRLDMQMSYWKLNMLFQHTAARRRLEPLLKALLRQVSQPRFR